MTGHDLSPFSPKGYRAMDRSPSSRANSGSLWTRVAAFEAAHAAMNASELLMLPLSLISAALLRTSSSGQTSSMASILTFSMNRKASSGPIFLRERYVSSNTVMNEMSSTSSPRSRASKSFLWARIQSAPCDAVTAMQGVATVWENLSGEQSSWEALT